MKEINLNELFNKKEPIGEILDKTAISMIKIDTNINSPISNIMIGSCSTNVSPNYISNFFNVSSPAFSNFTMASFFTNYGIICTVLEMDEHNWHFTYDSGFIPVNKIKYIQLKKGNYHYNINIYLKDNTYFKLAGRVYPKDNLSQMLTYYQNSNLASPKVTGNLFNIFNDTSFADSSQHVIDRKKYYSDNTGFDGIQTVKIQGRYTQNFNSDIFRDCIGTPKPFIISFGKNGILLMKVKMPNNFYYFSGQDYYVPYSYLSAETVINHAYEPELILVSPTFVIDIKELQDSRLLDYVQKKKFSDYISNLNPNVIPPVLAKTYFDKYRKEISRNYVSDNQSATKLLLKSALKDMKNNLSKIMVAIISYLAPVGAFIVLLFINMPFSVSISTLILTIIITIFLILIYCSKKAYLNSQAFDKVEYRRIKNISLLVCVLFLLLGIPTIRHLYSSKDNYCISGIDNQYVLTKKSVQQNIDKAKQRGTNMNFYPRQIPYMINISGHNLKEIGLSKTNDIAIHKKRHIEGNLSKVDITNDSINYETHLYYHHSTNQITGGLDDDNNEYSTTYVKRNYAIKHKIPIITTKELKKMKNIKNN